MQGDFSRTTFQPAKRYSRVLMQQGRVQLDADWNEQQEITQRRLEDEGVDIIGRTGVPKQNPGFAIGVSGGKLTISKGHLYVEGGLCVNDSDQPTVFLDAQEDCPVPAGALPGLSGPPSPGRYLVYCDAWERHIGPIEDPSLREIALGGPDTCTRAKLIWQVKLFPAGAAAQCGDFGPAWSPLPASGTLQARISPVPAPNPCLLPPTAGFKGLENQLYRVEVHKGGPRASAAFKWSRENASVAAAIETAAGQTLTLSDLGRDASLGFADGQWVEILDDAMELSGQRGTLVQIDTVDRARRQLNIKAATPVPAVDPNRHPKVRRWDQPDPTGGGDGVPMADDWIDLEAGIQVRFSDQQFRAGDYWLIPARTALGAETGSIEWPQDPATLQPAALSPAGIRHRYCPLAMVDFQTAGGFQASSLSDCRQLFPPLTAIQASDVGYDNSQCGMPGVKTVQQALDYLCAQDGGCAVHVPAKPGWESIFASLPARGDVHLCLEPGIYPLDKQAVVSGKGNIKITGSGRGTRIQALRSEGALGFRDCLSVEIRGLAVQTGVSDAANKSLNGALDFQACRSVLVEDASIATASGTQRASAAIAAKDRLDAPVAGGPAPVALTVRIRACDITVGSLQVGVLVVNPDRCTVEDNDIRVVPPAAADFRALADSRRFRKMLARQLVADAVTTSSAAPASRPGVHKAAARSPEALRAAEEAPAAGGAHPAAADAVRAAPAHAAASPQTVNETVTLGGHSITFRTPPALAGKWQALVEKNIQAGKATSPNALLSSVKRLSTRLLLKETDLKLTSLFGGLLGAILGQNLTAGSQGVVLAGSSARDARISGNAVSGFLMGVHCGFSHAGQAPADRDMAGTLRIAGNTLDIHLPLGSAGDRHGIFVGNCQQAFIEDNVISVVRARLLAKLPIEGIKAYGNFGRMLIVRQNQIDGATTGVLVKPLNNPGKSQWLVADNMMAGAQTPVSAPATVRKSENYA